MLEDSTILYTCISFHCIQKIKWQYVHINVHAYESFSNRPTDTHSSKLLLLAITYITTIILTTVFCQCNFY